jgi:hypothetical protein
MDPFKCRCGDVENCPTCRHRERVRGYRARARAIASLQLRGLLPDQIEEIRQSDIADGLRAMEANRHRRVRAAHG